MKQQEAGKRGNIGVNEARTIAVRASFDQALSTP
jgi:hypothetical protein